MIFLEIIGMVLLICTILFIIMYGTFMMQIPGDTYPNGYKITFKHANKLFWIFFKSFWGFNTGRINRI